IYDDYIGGLPSAATTTADTAPTPSNSSSQATNIPTLHMMLTSLKHSNNMFSNKKIKLHSNLIFSAESSSLQYVDPSNMYTFYQPYPHEYQWTKDHPLEQVIGEPSRLVLIRNQLRSDGDMCMYALTLRAQLYDKVSEQKDITKGTSANTKFENQSTSGTKLYSVTPFPNSKVIPKVVETNDLSKPVTSNLVPTTTESKL
ncbi:hypothetical protein Tco_1567922, partial [Tanacetum coccineum]